MGLQVCNCDIIERMYEFCLEPVDNSIDTLEKKLEEHLNRRMIIPLGYIQNPRIKVNARKRFYTYKHTSVDSFDICLSPWNRKAYIVILYQKNFKQLFLVRDISERIYLAVKDGKGEEVVRSEREYNTKTLKNIFNIPLVQKFIPSDSWKSY